MNNIGSKIFVSLFALSMILSTPYILGKHILKEDENSLNSDFISYDEDTYDTEELEDEEEIVIDSNIEDVAYTMSENIASYNIKDTKSNKKVMASKEKNKKTSNIKSNEKKSNTNTKKTSKSNKYTRVNSVSKPPMTYTSFKTVGRDYFNDALFIGDSRTEGLRLYGTLKNATYFSDVGMSTGTAFKRTISVKGVGKVNLNQLLTKKKFGKVYIMLGINGVGGNPNKIAAKYGELIDLIKKTQPNSIIYIEGNLHVAKSRNDRDKTINNNRINNLNAKMASFANNKDIIYIDINYLFDDSDGNLKSNMTSDATHVYAKYYKDWCEWLKQHAAS